MLIAIDRRLFGVPCVVLRIPLAFQRAEETGLLGSLDWYGLFASDY